MKKKLKDLSKDKIEEEFYKFLKENNAYKSFINYTFSKGENVFSKHPKDWITFTFAWYLTTEGMNYWINLNEKWRAKLSEIKYKDTIIDLI